MYVRRIWIALAGILATLVVVAGCATTDADTDDAATSADDGVVFDINQDIDTPPMAEHDDAVVADVVRFDPPELDSAAMDADLPEGTVIDSLDHTFVGRVTDDLFIAISMDDRYAWQARDVVVYLCDGIDTAAYFVGEFDPDGTTLTGHVLEVEFTMENGVVSGTVALPNETHDFTAQAATGPAGLFVASHQQDGNDVSTWWIVLEDGEQRGSIMDLPCIPVPRFGCIPLPRMN